jgi:hypothetical protein
MQIELPDHFASLAIAAGFANVEEYVKFLVNNDVESAEDGEGDDDYAELPLDEWQRKFREFRARLKPGNPNFDDSRESMYPVR